MSCAIVFDVITELSLEPEGDKIEKVLDVRKGPVGFVGNQTIVYNSAEMPEITEETQTEKQYLIKVSWLYE